MDRNSNNDRQPKGIPVGGQFAAKVSPEAKLDLASEIAMHRDSPASFMNERVDALRSHGFVSAATAPMLVDP